MKTVIISLYFLALFPSTYAHAGANDFLLEKEFSLNLIRQVRTTLRVSQHFVDHYIACLKDNKKWFKDNYFSKDKKDVRNDPRMCKTRIPSLKEKIKEKFTKMKLFLILSRIPKNFLYHHDNKITDPENYPHLFSWPLFYQVSTVEHIHSGLASLGYISKEEAIAAVNILNNDLEASILTQKKVEPEFDHVCANSESRIDPKWYKHGVFFRLVYKRML